MLFKEIRKSEKAKVCAEQDDEFSSLPARHVSGYTQGRTNFIPLIKTESNTY